jgi:hypothetical protein
MKRKYIILGSAILLIVLFMLTLTIPPNEIRKHFKDQDMEVGLTGWNFSFNYGLKYCYRVKNNEFNWTVSYSIIPWGNIEVPPSGNNQ